MSKWDDLTDEQKIRIQTTDAATQRKLCREWGLPFPGFPELGRVPDPNEGNDE